MANYRNGSVIGVANTPTSIVASGVYDLEAHQHYVGEGTWPTGEVAFGWNGSDKGANMGTPTTTVNTNDTVTASSSGFHGIRAAKSFSLSVKAYWEVDLPTFAADKHLVGIADNDASMGAAAYNSARTASTRGSSDFDPVNTWTEDGNPSYTESSGSYIMFAFDGPAGKLWVGHNGSWLTSGDPAAGTNQWVSGIDEAVFPMFIGEPGTVGVLRTLLSDFEGAVPSGFSSAAAVAT